MSGGSFEYLCWKDPDAIMARLDLLDDMAEYLTEHGAPDAAEETRRIAEEFRALSLALDGAAGKPIRDLWHAAEWTRSCDWGEDQLAEAVERWRSERARTLAPASPNAFASDEAPEDTP